jgi:large subunit ribosomal protein L27
LYSGQKARAGNIIVRQKGTKIFGGQGVMMGNDYTLFAVKEGIINFKTLRGKKIVEVVAS